MNTSATNSNSTKRIPKIGDKIRVLVSGNGGSILQAGEIGSIDKLEYDLFRLGRPATWLRLKDAGTAWEFVEEPERTPKIGDKIRILVDEPSSSAFKAGEIGIVQHVGPYDFLAGDGAHWLSARSQGVHWEYADKAPDASSNIRYWYPLNLKNQRRSIAYLRTAEGIWFGWADLKPGERFERKLGRYYSTPRLTKVLEKYPGGSRLTCINHTEKYGFIPAAVIVASYFEDLLTPKSLEGKITLLDFKHKALAKDIALFIVQTEMEME